MPSKIVSTSLHHGKVTHFTLPELRREFAGMTTRELLAYRTMLRMPTLQSEADRRQTDLHRRLVEEILRARFIEQRAPDPHLPPVYVPPRRPPPRHELPRTRELADVYEAQERLQALRASPPPPRKKTRRPSPQSPAAPVTGLGRQDRTVTAEEITGGTLRQIVDRAVRRAMRTR